MSFRALVSPITRVGTPAHRAAETQRGRRATGPAGEVAAETHRGDERPAHSGPPTPSSRYEGSDTSPEAVRSSIYRTDLARSRDRQRPKNVIPAWEWYDRTTVSQDTTAPSLAVQPEEPMLDERIEVRASGLAPGEEVTLEVVMEWNETTYVSRGTYEADDAGVVDPSQIAPVAGTYGGVEPMGLFWSMRPESGPADPGTVPARLLTIFTLRRRGDVAAKVEIVRRSRPTGVSRRTIEAAGLPADLYLPPGEGPHPGVVVLGGSEGGRPGRAMPWLLAARGYAVLGPAYFGEDGAAADELVEVPVEAVESAVDWFGERQRVQRAPMAVIGRSRGSELAFLLAGRMDRLRVVVGISPSGIAFEGLTKNHRNAGVSAWSLAGKPYEAVSMDVTLGDLAGNAWSMVRGDPVETVGAYLGGLNAADPETVDAAELPVELIAGPVCLLAGEDDRVWDAATLARRVRDRLADTGYEYHVACHTYPDAGHALSVPYLPTTNRETARRGRLDLVLGGTPAGYAEADEAGWRAILGTLRAIRGSEGSSD